MKSVLGAVLATALISTPSLAETGSITYLNCSLNGNPWEVSLNEEAGRVSYVHSNGVVYEQAVFTADSVVWESRIGRFTISRVDLSLTFTMGENVTRGECTMTQAPNRAF